MKIGVVIPCYKVNDHIIDVISAIGPEVDRIFAVDDLCPDGAGDFIEANVNDARVLVIRNAINLGVGGAVLAGYRAGLEEDVDIFVKIDGDGQMDPSLLPQFVAPLIAMEADYAKGNRFFSATAIKDMPRVRLIGNALLSFMTKLSSGYWSLFDPTNGYTAIHSKALEALDLGAISKRYFFETDMLIRLGEMRAVVIDIPMRAVYGDEVSGLKISRILGEFLKKHLKSTVRRVVYQYFLRDFSFASVNLIFGIIMVFFGAMYGSFAWFLSVRDGVPATTGTVMLSALPIIVGLQMLLFFLSHDIAQEPKRPIQKQTVVPSLLVSGKRVAKLADTKANRNLN